MKEECKENIGKIPHLRQHIDTNTQNEKERERKRRKQRKLIRVYRKTREEGFKLGATTFNIKTLNTMTPENSKILPC